jgi:hypothetical protein
MLLRTSWNLTTLSPPTCRSRSPRPWQVTLGAPAPALRNAGKARHPPVPLSAPAPDTPCATLPGSCHTAASFPRHQRSCTPSTDATPVLSSAWGRRSMLGLWHGAQFCMCSLYTVPSAPSSTMRALAPTRCTLYAPLDTDTSVLSASCRRR